MRVLQLNRSDLLGQGYNGFNLHQSLKSREDIESSMLVWDRLGDDPDVEVVTESLLARTFIERTLRKAHRRLSVQNLFYPTHHWVERHPAFRRADVVHFHLVHSTFLSIGSLPRLMNAKPSVWSLHDPWAFSGLCTYPVGCTRWETGCGECPQIEQGAYKMKTDRTAYLWQKKREAFARLDTQIVVASKHMQQIAERSPLIGHLPIHHIPYGIDTNIYVPGDKRAARAQLGIPDHQPVIGLRSTNNPYKGMDRITEALQSLSYEGPITLVAFEDGSIIERQLDPDQFRVVDLGWITDLGEVSRAYQAMDFFLMPSIEEAFGLMAVEAMSCAIPSIVFEGTALPDVVFAPRGGRSVPYDEAPPLRDAIDDWLADPGKREAIGAEARELAVTHYDRQNNYARLVELYQKLMAGRAVA